METLKINDKAWRLDILRKIKKDFNTYLGRYTHKQISDDWHFKSIGFVNDQLGYVFGFNIGFFRKDQQESLQYSHAGMNVLVRTNGENTELRMKYKEFFEMSLKKWITLPKDSYSSFRGGVGIELARMKKINSFENQEELIDFLKESIFLLSKYAYPNIVNCRSKIFDSVVRGAPAWDEKIYDIALACSKNLKQTNDK